MKKEITSRNLALITVALCLCIISSCADARPPGTQKSAGDIEMGPPEKVQIGALEYAPMRIEADFNGWETSFERMRITHMAIGADDDYENLVKATVTVNDELAGFLYADGWEGSADEELRIGPGDRSVWVPMRGTWNHFPETNIMKLTFAKEGLTDFDPVFFRGYLYLKNDPMALEEEAMDTTDDAASEISSG